VISPYAPPVEKHFQEGVRGTADPSASLGMTKGTATLSFRFDIAEDEQQVPPLRYAPVGMTLLCGRDKRSRSSLTSATHRSGTDKERVEAVFHLDRSVVVCFISGSVRSVPGESQYDLFCSAGRKTDCVRDLWRNLLRRLTHASVASQPPKSSQSLLATSH
jgi:hypothetical protein